MGYREKSKKIHKKSNSSIAFSVDKHILLYRTNAIRESIRSHATDKVYFLAKAKEHPLLAECRKEGIPFEIIEAERFNALSNGQPHQGAVAFCKQIPLFSLDELIAKADCSEAPIILMLDGIEDPHNMGAILRSVDAFNIDGVIVKNSNNAPINATVANISTGAIFYTPICVVSNLSYAVSKLKQSGYWIASSDGSAAMSYQDLDYERKWVFVVGSEGFGISSLVLKNSDYIVKIPMEGHVNSLNASVATAILLSYARSIRHGHQN